MNANFGAFSARRLFTFVAGIAISAILSTGNAAAVSCSGSHNAATFTGIVYNAVTESCTIIEVASVTTNSFGIFLSPVDLPDTYRSAATNASAFILPNSFTVNGVSGVVTDTFLDVFQDFSGPVIATLVATIPGFGQFKMIANLRADGGQNIYIDSATVSAVPVPPAIVLLGTALVGMAGFKRLKRRRATIVA